MRTTMLGALMLWGLSLGMVGCCSEDEETTGAAATGTTETLAPGADQVAGTAVADCGGELRLLEGDRVHAGGRTVDCGDLDQLLTDEVIDHTCLGAISKSGGRSCIERFVESSRGRSRVLKRGPSPSAPAAPVEEPEP